LEIIIRALIQRALSGKVTVDRTEIAKIGQGFVILLGISPTDGEQQCLYLVDKIANLRVFEDDNGKMNKSLLDIGGSVLLVSQFTLYANTAKGRRPSYNSAAPPEIAEPLVNRFAEMLIEKGIPTQTGRFGAHMLLDIQNDGPVTISLERQ
jgi:D-tyrosyl-tRNA(Tyr) deacylase